MLLHARGMVRPLTILWLATAACASSTTPEPGMAWDTTTSTATASSSTGPAPASSEGSSGTPQDAGGTSTGSVADLGGSDTDAPGIELPAGRSSFVVALMGVKGNASWVRLATWAFADDGTIAEDYWYWDQTQAPELTDPYATRIQTGYRTTGCPKVCDVWTTRTFEPGAPPPFSRVGTWVYDELGNVAITWDTGFHESYAVVDHGAYAQLTLASHEYGGVSTVYASVYGSNAPLEVGATIDEIADVAALDFVSHEKNWDSEVRDISETIWWGQYNRCTDAPCLQGMNPAIYHTYFAGVPETDGRKVYWYHQLEVVALDPNCAQIDRGGHTYELLQILDDDGGFVGFVGVETSLLGQRTGGDILTHFTALRQDA